MSFRRMQGFSLAGLVAFSISIAIGTSGCPKKPPATPTPTPEPTATRDDGSGVGGEGTGDSGTGMDGAEAGCEMEAVLFSLDSATLDSSATSALRQAAECLSRNGTWTVAVEGHADERGSTQYNLALGERRARSVAGYLTDAGINGSRIQTVSFGEEKPVDPGHDEAAWAANRRVEFRVKK